MSDAILAGGARTPVRQDPPRLRIDVTDDRVVATLDRPDRRNAIDQAMVDELHALCAALEERPRTLVLTGAGGIFSAGADIRQLRERTGDDARRGINATVFDRIHHLPMPVIAAIDGFALGGGAELAYAADIRIGTSRARFGNPEPGLGIIAAAGATWRLPEIIGHARASELLLTARTVDADEALAWGLMSSVHEPDDLLAAAHAIADRIAANSARATVLTKRALLAPRAAHPAIDGELQVELFDSTDTHRRMTAFLERKKPADPGTAASVHAAPPAPADPGAAAATEPAPPASLPALVGVLGGGRMGAGIAHAFLLAGARVHVVERDAATADAARARVEDALAGSVQRGVQIPDADTLTVGTDLTAFSGAGLVVEAVPEDRGVKLDALRRIEEVVDDAAVVASNTSSISIDALAASLRLPARFLGLHFFNPVPASALVEVVRGAQTDPRVIEHATRWVGALGKAAVVVRDAPGFASSRLGVALGLEAIRMVEEGVASPHDIDLAMERGYRHPMGPLRTTDIVGLDVRLDIAEELERAFGARFTPPALLRRLVAEGHLGRKTGRGFYEWSDR